MGSAAGLPGVRNPGDHSCSRDRNGGSAQLSSLNAIAQVRKRGAPAVGEGTESSQGQGGQVGWPPRSGILYYSTAWRTKLIFYGPRSILSWSQKSLSFIVIIF